MDAFAGRCLPFRHCSAECQLNQFAADPLRDCDRRLFHPAARSGFFFTGSGERLSHHLPDHGARRRICNRLRRSFGSNPGAFLQISPCRIQNLA